MRHVEIPPSSPSDSLQGSLERITFHNAETGFCVLKIKVKGQRDLITVTGSSLLVSIGEWVTATGSWTHNPVHGRQFKACDIQTARPTHLDGLERYLASGAIHGIGPVYAQKIVAAFGNKVFEVMDCDPDQLRRIEGIGPQRAARILDSWKQYQSTRDLIVFLHQHQISSTRALKIYQRYGSEAIDLITENPYRLSTEIYGIGFQSADKLAQSLGLSQNDPQRIQAGLLHTLQEALSQGHCGVPEDTLIQKTQTLIQCSAESVQESLSQVVAAGEVAFDGDGEHRLVFSRLLFNMEISISQHLKNLLHGDRPWPDIYLSKALPWVEKKLSIQLADSQKEGCAFFLWEIWINCPLLDRDPFSLTSFTQKAFPPHG